MATCFCCPKPRYKRLVDGLFPEDPQTPTPVSANMDKLLFFAQTSPDHLDNIGEYLALRLRRSLQRERNGLDDYFRDVPVQCRHVMIMYIAIGESYRPSPYLRNRKWCIYVAGNFKCYVYNTTIVSNGFLTNVVQNTIFMPLPPPRHVSVALQVTEKLLSACDSRKLQLIVDSYLDILHNMLETSNTELHIMATNSVSRECVWCGCVSRVCWWVSAESERVSS